MTGVFDDFTITANCLPSSPEGSEAWDMWISERGARLVHHPEERSGAGKTCTLFERDGALEQLKGVSLSVEETAALLKAIRKWKPGNTSIPAPG